MNEVICSKCKLNMIRSEKQDEPDFDIYICRSCGSKKRLPKKSPEKLEKEKRLSGLDKESASGDDAFPEPEKTESKDKPEIIVRTKSKNSSKESEEKTLLYAKTDVPEDKNTKTKPDEDSKNREKIRNLEKEIEILAKELKDTQLSLKAREIEIKKMTKDIKSFLGDLTPVMDDLRSSLNSKSKSIDNIIEALKKEMG